MEQGTKRNEVQCRFVPWLKGFVFDFAGFLFRRLVKARAARSGTAK
jgi:hypothetical protein